MFGDDNADGKARRARAGPLGGWGGGAGGARRAMALVALSGLTGTMAAYGLLRLAGVLGNEGAVPENCELRALDNKPAHQPHHAAVAADDDAAPWRVAFVISADVLPLSHDAECAPTVDAAPGDGALLFEEHAPSCGIDVKETPSQPTPLAEHGTLTTRFLAITSDNEYEPPDDGRPVQRWHFRLRLPCGIGASKPTSTASPAPLDVVVHRTVGAFAPLGSAAADAARETHASLLMSTEAAWGGGGVPRRERRRDGAAALATAAAPGGRLPALRLSPGSWGDADSADVMLEVRAFALRGSVRLAQEVALHAAGLIASGELGEEDTKGASIFVRCSPEAAAMVLASLTYTARGGASAAALATTPDVEDAIFVSVTATASIAAPGDGEFTLANLDRVASVAQQAVLEASPAASQKRNACGDAAQADGAGLRDGPAFAPVTVAVWCAGVEGDRHDVAVEITSLDAPTEPGTDEAFTQRIIARFDANQVAYIARFLRPEGRYNVVVSVDGVESKRSPHRVRGEPPTTAAPATTKPPPKARPPPKAKAVSAEAAATPTPTTKPPRPLTPGMLAAMRDGAHPEDELPRLSSHTAIDAAAGAVGGPPGYASARRRQADRAVTRERERAHAAAQLAYDRATGGGARGNGGANVAPNHKRVRRLPPDGMRGEALGPKGAPEVESIDPHLLALAEEDLRLASFTRAYKPHGVPGSGKFRSGVMRPDEFEIPGLTPAGAAPRMLAAKLVGKHKLGRDPIHFTMSSQGYTSDPTAELSLGSEDEASEEEEELWKELSSNS